MKQVIIVSNRDQSPKANELRTKLDSFKKQKKAYFPYGYYLHGNLEKYWYYDLCDIVNFEELECVIKPASNKQSQFTYKIFLKPGIYDVIVIGVDKPCVGYFWFSNDIRYHGLICFKDDADAIRYAREQYNTKSTSI